MGDEARAAMADGDADARPPLTSERLQDDGKTDRDEGDVESEPPVDDDATARSEARESASQGSDDDDDINADETDNVDALESLFTEPTELDDVEQGDNEVSVEEEEVAIEVDEKGHNEAAGDDHDAETDGLLSSIKSVSLESLPATPIEEMAQMMNLTASPAVVPANHPERFPAPPMLPARPARPAQVPMVNTAAALPSSSETTTATPLQLVNLDVGGKLFRCKASLIRKFPTKRLHQVISCGCEQIGHDTFFIDRNPLHFELVLDWYRTGKSARPLPPHVNEEALKEDAKYFDLFEEMFPPPSTTSAALPAPAIPPRNKITQSGSSATTPPTVLPRLPDRLSQQPTPHDQPAKMKPPLDVVRFTKREIRSIAPIDLNPPAWFCVRAHEHLVVDSVRGSGKLLVRVTDLTGMARVFVDQAVLFDSRSWFYLDDGGRTRLQYCVLPGNHVYTFWMEPLASDQAPIPSPPRQAPKPMKQAKTLKGQIAPGAPLPPPAKSELEVEFRLVSTFSQAEEMDTESELTAVLLSKGNGWGDVHGADGTGAGAALTTTADPTAEPKCLFLPPRHVEPSPLVENKFSAERMDLDQRDAIAEQIRLQATKERLRKVETVEEDSAIATRSGGALTRGGAAIAQPHRKHPPSGHGGDKVTVYQPIPPPAVAAPPRSPANPSKKQPSSSGASYSAQQPRQFRQR